MSSFLTAPERRRIFERVLAVLDQRFASLPLPDTERLRARHEPAILENPDVETFEARMNAMVTPLASHTGFYNRRAPRATEGAALGASVVRHDAIDGHRWQFRRVDPAGPAARAGIGPGDVWLEVDDASLFPPSRATFRFGRAYALRVRKPAGAHVRTVVDVPPHPYRSPSRAANPLVSAIGLSPETAVLRVTGFPGNIGVDVARDMTRALATLQPRRLIVDLRQCVGGGIGCLRLASLLCPDRRGVCYTQTRSRMGMTISPDRLPTLSRIPHSRAGIAPLCLLFWPVLTHGAMSLAVVTESLGPQPYHGRVVVLTDEESNSAAEIVAAFVDEHRVAALVGAPTAGRLVWSGEVCVGRGYRLRLPLAVYRSWRGTLIEGAGVQPHIPVPSAVTPDAPDLQFARALEIVHAL